MRLADADPRGDGAGREALGPQPPGLQFELLRSFTPVAGGGHDPGLQLISGRGTASGPAPGGWGIFGDERAVTSAGRPAHVGVGRLDGQSPGSRARPRPPGYGSYAYLISF